MSQPASPATTTSPPAPGGWVHVAEMKDLARRKRKQVSVGGCPIALFLVDDEVFAMDDVCVHKERFLTKGTVLNARLPGTAAVREGTRAEFAVPPSALHFFDLTTGQAITPTQPRIAVAAV